MAKLLDATIPKWLARSMRISRLMTTRLSFGKREWLLAYRVALKILKAPDQAEDAAQDALLSAFTARRHFAGRSRPESWLYRIAHNTALTHLRRPFARRYDAADVFATIDERCSDGRPSPENHAYAREIAARLDVCLHRLRHEDRIAFTERFLLGTSERELGEILGVSTNAAKQRAFRARRAVRSGIAETGLTP